MKTRPLAALICLLAATACTKAEVNYPSLAPRPVESRSEEEESAPLPLPAPADAATAARIDALLADARRGEADFARLLPEAERAIGAARGKAADSEAWIAGQQMLSALDAARTPTAAAMTAIDSLYVDLAARATADASVGGLGEADAARGEVESLYGAQVAHLSALQAALSPS